MSVLCVASDEEGVGKTAFCVALAHLLGQQGKKASIFKPFKDKGAGRSSDPDRIIYEKLSEGSESEDIQLKESDATVVDGEWPDTLGCSGVDRALLDGLASRLVGASADNDVVIVELSSALARDDTRDVVDALSAHVVVVAGYSRELRAVDLKPWVDALGERLIGIVLNSLPRYLATEADANLARPMQSDGIRLLGIVPDDRGLLGATVSQVSQHLNGRILQTDGDLDGLVEHFMVGGYSLNPGELYFEIHDRKAAVIRGDRPDMQMAALATPTTCLLLTNGKEPIEYVRYEAEQEQVPIVLVETDTLATMSALETLIDDARFDHPRKMERFAELMQAHVDMDAILSRL